MDEFENLITVLPAAVAPLVCAADAAVRAENPTVVRIVWSHQRTIGYGVGPKKLSEHYAYLDVYDTHLNLGFNRGAALPDPDGLLVGTGKAFRRFAVHDVEDVDRPAIRQLLRAAQREREQALPSRQAP